MAVIRLLKMAAVRYFGFSKILTAHTLQMANELIDHLKGMGS